jgi:hypothetical protein
VVILELIRAQNRTLYRVLALVTSLKATVITGKTVFTTKQEQKQSR